MINWVLIENLTEIKSGQQKNATYLVPNLYGTRLYAKNRGWGRIWHTYFTQYPENLLELFQNAWQSTFNELERAVPKIERQVREYKAVLLKQEQDLALRNSLALWILALPKDQYPDLHKELRPLRQFFQVEDTLRLSFHAFKNLPEKKTATWVKKLNRTPLSIRSIHKAFKLFFLADAYKWESWLWQKGCTKFEELDPKRACDPGPPQTGLTLHAANEAILPIWIDNLAKLNPFSLEIAPQMLWGTKKQWVNFPELVEMSALIEHPNQKRVLVEIACLIKVCFMKGRMPQDLSGLALDPQGRLTLVKPMTLAPVDCITLNDWLYTICKGDLQLYTHLKQTSTLVDHPQYRLMRKVFTERIPANQIAISKWDQIDQPHFLAHLQRWAAEGDFSKV